MKYIVIELQVGANGAVANIVTAHDSRFEAESKYHAVLASAAVSTVPKHSAVVMDDEGAVLGSQTYRHETEVAQ
jgi:hypothetical protein